MEWAKNTDRLVLRNFSRRDQPFSKKWKVRRKAGTPLSRGRILQSFVTIRSAEKWELPKTNGQTKIFGEKREFPQKREFKQTFEIKNSKRQKTNENFKRRNLCPYRCGKNHSSRTDSF
ncbi:hypothetical protein DLM78_05560 [Leptospira stimsonii]|uniref:Uncharacterized protein n=1 Tax=Leptospira stimsonii TaxID=2202203 RepID=A0A8B3CT22_9LEPT|nr:hypothetical protein DLM78_05560 [Leptospira stimsonii]